MHLDDPLYGTIEIPVVLKPIAQSRALGRLAAIQQTHFTELPTEGGFNRYNHSTGVALLAGIMADWLGSRGIINETDRVHLLVACIVHDICHLPFGHVLEGLYEFSHETMLHDYLRAELGREFAESASTSGTPISIARLVDVIIGRTKTPIDYLLHDILKGVASLDRLDYVVRDSYRPRQEGNSTDALRHFESLLGHLMISDHRVVLPPDFFVSKDFEYYSRCIRLANESCYMDWKTRLKYRCFFELLKSIRSITKSPYELLAYDDRSFLRYVVEANPDLSVNGSPIRRWISESCEGHGYDLLESHEVGLARLDGTFRRFPIGANRKTVRFAELRTIERRIIETALASAGDAADYRSLFSNSGSFLLDFPPYPRTISLLNYKDSPAEKFTVGL